MRKMAQNLEGLPVYNSTRSLSSASLDYSNVFIIPSICLFGLVTSTLNIIVLAKLNFCLSKKETKPDYYHLYMLIVSLSDFSFLLTQLFIAIIRCGVLCSFSYTYVAKLYELYVYLTVGYVIITFSALVDISVAIDRVRLMSDCKLKLASRQKFALRCIILLVLSAIVILPDYVLTNEVTAKGVLLTVSQRGNETWYSYEILYAKSSKYTTESATLQIPVAVTAVIKGPVMIGLMVIVDSLVVIKFRAYLNRKVAITRSKFIALS